MSIYYYDTEFSEDGTIIDLISIGIVSEDGREFYCECSEFDESKCNDWVKENVLPKLGPKESRKTKAEIRKDLLTFLQNDISPRFVGYVSAYDHVVLAQLFGKMVDMPDSFPHYTYDFKQKLEELGDPFIPNREFKGEHNALADAKWLKMACEYLMKEHKFNIPANNKSKKVESMIAVRYQLLFLCPKAEKSQQLIAIEPLFTSPSAVDAQMKTARWEDKIPVVVVGLQPALDNFLKKLERADAIDWADYELEERKVAVIDLAKSMGLSCYEKLRTSEFDNMVLGDEVAVSVEAKTKIPYPPDLPHGNKDIWDAIRTGEDFKEGMDFLKKAGKHKDEELVTAAYRNFYEMYCELLGRLPWVYMDETKLKDKRNQLKGMLIQGEEKGSMLVEELENHLLWADIIAKTRAQKFNSVIRHPQNNRYVLVHEVPWVMHPGKHTWKTLTTFLIREMGKKHAFKESREKITTQVDISTELEIRKESEDKVMVFINQYLNEPQAKILTREEDHDKIVKRLTTYMKKWYSAGKFPDIEQI